MVTIITASYNAAKTIRQTIASVRNIKTEGIEYIIIDGLSTDATCDIIRENMDIIDFFISERDDGIYDAINKGIRVAHGEYTLFLAADDLIIPGAIEHFLETVKRDTDVWSGSIVFHNKYGYFIEKSERNLEQLKHECSLRHPATFFKRSSFDTYGYYDSTFKCSGDREIFLRFYINGANFQVEDFLIEIFNEGGISTSNPLDLPVKEGRMIEKRYNIYGGSIEALNQKRRMRYRRKNTLFGRLLSRLFYSFFAYSIYSRITGNPTKKIRKQEICDLMGERN